MTNRDQDQEQPSVSVSIQCQMVFAESGLAPEEGPTGTSLEDFGVAVDHRERETRHDKPAASAFGVDDRPVVRQSEGGEQSALFASADDDQRTLAGERAAGRSLF